VDEHAGLEVAAVQVRPAGETVEIDGGAEPDAARIRADLDAFRERLRELDRSTASAAGQG
jgi:hypothetical protein